VRLAALALGFATIGIQTLVLRELVATWQGDETSFGLTLAVWLVAAGTGSSLGARLFSADGRPRSHLAVALLLLGLLAPVSVLAARSGRLVLGAGSGEITGVLTVLIAALISAGPFAAAAGASFSLTVRSLSRTDPSRRPTSAARVYALEAAGAVLAGLVLSFILIPFSTAVAAAGLVTLALGSTGLALLAMPPDPGRGTHTPCVTRALRVTAVCVALAGVTLLTPAGDALEAATIRGQWMDRGFVLSRDSVHGRVVATRRGSQVALYENGVLASSAPDRLAAEEAVHLPMLMHKRPRRVLLVGGGLGGSVAEVLKHPSVTAVDYVELDPVLLSVAREAFGDSLLAGLDDPRVRVHYGDGRLYVRESNSVYDVLIVTVPDPITTQLNRFYTAEFFGEARRLLGDSGVLGMTVSGSENYVSPELSDLLLSIESSLAVAFERVALLPGDPCHLLAGGDSTRLLRDGASLSAIVEDRGIANSFMARHYLEDRLSAARLASFDATLARHTGPGLNSDLRPRGQLAGLVVRSILRTGSSRLLLSSRRVLNLPTVAVAAGALVLVFGLVPLLSQRRRGVRNGFDPAFARAIAISVVVVGFTEMSLEVSALVAYQSLYGLVYGRIALIAAAFMGGLALGGWLGTRLASRGALERRYLLLQTGITVVPVGFALAVTAFSAAASAGHAGAAFFPALVAASAVLAGIQFPLASAILLGRPGAAVTRQAGALYAADLLGAAFGAAATSLVLLPVLGAIGTMGALAMLNLAVLVALALTTERGRLRRDGLASYSP